MEAEESILAALLLSSAYNGPWLLKQSWEWFQSSFAKNCHHLHSSSILSSIFTMLHSFSNSHFLCTAASIQFCCTFHSPFYQPHLPTLTPGSCLHSCNQPHCFHHLLSSPGHTFLLFILQPCFMLLLQLAVELHTKSCLSEFPPTWFHSVRVCASTHPGWNNAVRPGLK